MEIVMIMVIFLLSAYAFEWILRQLKIKNYNDRFVLITGCDSGFGHMLAVKLEKMGFNVFACCLTKHAVEEFNKTSSSKLKAIEMDVTKDASIEKAMEIVKTTLPEGKGLWAVVNNAGIIGGIGSTYLHTRQDYENTLAVNLYGVIMVTKACMPLVLKEKGRIVNMSSVSGRIANVNPSYTVSKYGVEAFSDILRREMYKTGVKVQIIEPGAFKTPLWSCLQKLSEDKVSSLTTNVKMQLTNDPAEKILAPYKKFAPSTQYHLVIDAYIHAIIARYPRKRYLVGNDAKFSIRLLWTVPESLCDFVFVKLGFYDM